MHTVQKSISYETVITYLKEKIIACTHYVMICNLFKSPAKNIQINKNKVLSRCFKALKKIKLSAPL